MMHQESTLTNNSVNIKNFAMCDAFAPFVNDLRRLNLAICAKFNAFKFKILKLHTLGFILGNRFSKILQPEPKSGPKFTKASDRPGICSLLFD